MKTKYFNIFFIVSLFLLSPVYSQDEMNSNDYPQAQEAVPLHPYVRVPTQHYVEGYVPTSDFGGYDAFRYFSVGVGPAIYVPCVGVGYRERTFKYGWDSAVNFATNGSAHQLSAHMVGHYYLNPLSKKSAYLGLGVLGSGVFTNHKGNALTLSPDFVVGKELDLNIDSRQFIEMHVGFPTLWIGSVHSSYSQSLTFLYVKYGIAF